MEPLEEPRPLSAADRAAGVAWDCRVRLGVHGTGPVVRVVRVVAGETIFHLVTSRQDLPAEIIGLIYRHRWEIEVFFKWLKTIFNCRHWLAESPGGATIQLYTVLVGALLLMMWTGQRPNRRMVEVFRLYLMGWASEEELLALLKRAAGLKKR
jgi:IS4 transposase